MKISASRFMAVGAAAAGTALISAAPSFAQNPTSTFAQFLQQTNTQAFTLTNDGATSTITANDKVDFRYFIPNGYSDATGTPQNAFRSATLSLLVSNPTGPASGSNTTGTRISETFATYSLSITADTPVNGKTNLLTATGSNLVLRGTYNEGSSTLQVSTPPDGDVTFTSDFTSFATSTDRNFAISMSSVVPVFAIDTNGYVRGFSAAGTGTFATNTVAAVPEPGMVTFALTGGMGLAGMVLRGRRRISRSKKSA